jgi:hypothetical protein
MFVCDQAVAMKSVSILLALNCMLVTGCVPFKIQVGRPTQGTVISKESHAGISGAQVMYKGHPKTTVVTDADGRFVLEQATVTKWLVPIPADYFGWRWHPLRVRAQGYRDITFEQASQDPAPGVVIELTPLR